MVVFPQKKNSKILNKLITAMLAVLCVALLCVPAFASAPADGDFVVILPESQPVYDEEDGAFYPSFVNVPVVGSVCIVNWNGVKFFCVTQDASAFFPGSVLLGDGTNFGLSGNGEPFLISIGLDNGQIEGFIVPLDGSTELTISIYQVVDSSASLFTDISTFVDSSVGWVGQFVNVVTAQPLLLCFCIVIFVGVGVGLISRIKK